jgi:ribosomal protein S18 acetylase RimI-like enzyme
MDMLIKLFEPLARAAAAAPSHLVRKPIGPEQALVVRWVAATFSAGWASEAQVALANRPVSLFIATRAESLVGFCCYDATARGLVGPIGVAPQARGGGIGAALLLACLSDMRAVGYGYAIVGGVGAPEFFQRVAGAIEIQGSTPGLYAGMLRP